MADGRGGVHPLVDLLDAEHVVLHGVVEEQELFRAQCPADLAAGQCVRVVVVVVVRVWWRVGLLMAACVAVPHRD